MYRTENEDQLKKSYEYAKRHGWPFTLYKTLVTFPFNKDPQGLFYIDMNLEDETRVYGMVSLDEHGTPENVFRFLRCVLSRNTIFQTLVQKEIPASWEDGITQQLRHQIVEHLWVRLKVIADDK